MNTKSENRTSRLPIIRKSTQMFRRIMIILLIGIILFTYWKYFFTYSEGYRAGLLQKFSHKGTFFKTYEGEMVLSSVTSNVDVVLASEKFYFSVTNKKLAKQLDTIQGQKVMVHYKQKNGVLFWRGDTKYQVDSVKYIP